MIFLSRFCCAKREMKKKRENFFGKKMEEVSVKLRLFNRGNWGEKEFKYSFYKRWIARKVQRKKEKYLQEICNFEYGIAIFKTKGGNVRRIKRKAKAETLAKLF